MNPRMKAVSAVLAAMLLAGCAVAEPTPPPTGENPCPIVSSSDWKAWVNARPGPAAKPQLIATGKVIAPTGGFTFAWRDLRIMESHPVQVIAELEALPAEDPASQGDVTHDLRGEWPIDPPVGSLTITCGTRTLARISPVETAH
jgi:hypothetical protein